MKRRTVLIVLIGMLTCGCAGKEKPEDAASAVTAELQVGAEPAEGAAGTTADDGSRGGVAELQIGGDIAAASSSDASEDVSGSAPAAGDPQAQADAYISDYIAQEQTITFANLTGRDLSEIRITFSEGGLNDVELLQGTVLRDGAGVHYRIEELSELRTAEHLKLSVSAVATDDTRMEFTAIPIWDISSTNIVLSTEDGEYTMYLE